MTDAVGRLDPTDAFDEAFTGGRTYMIDGGGRSQLLEVAAWSADPDAVDLQLFVDPCDGATLDVGCGPGRLVGELTARGIDALGIDVSAEAVRQARVRGAAALCLDVFDEVPAEGRWRFALLADGNIGIGGDPVRLLARLRDLLHDDGRMIVELEAHGIGIVRERRRLQVAGRLSQYFDWAVVGLDAIGDMARGADLDVVATRSIGGRHTATLARAQT